MYSLRINDNIYNILSGSYTYTLGQASSAEFILLAYEAKFNVNIKLGQDVKLYFNNVILFSGFISQQPIISINSNKLLTVSIQCMSDLGKLALMPALLYANFYQEYRALIISHIVNRSNVKISFYKDVLNWPFAYKGAANLSVNLTNKTSLLEQLTAVLEFFPGMSYRENPTSNYLEFGMYLDTPFSNRYSFNLGGNLLNLNIEQSNKDAIAGIYGYGGVTQNPYNRATLQRASIYSPVTTSALYSDFPIVYNTENRMYYVKNNSVKNSIFYKTMIFDEAKPLEDGSVAFPPNVSETMLNEASYALYTQCVSELINSSEYITYSGEIYATEYSPMPGDQAEIYANMKESFMDNSVNTINIQDNIAIQKISHNINDYFSDENGSPILKYSFSGTNAITKYLTNQEFVELYDIIKPDQNIIASSTKFVHREYFTQTIYLNESSAANYRFEHLNGIKNEYTYYNGYEATILPPSMTFNPSSIFNVIDVRAIRFQNMAISQKYIFYITKHPTLTSQTLKIAIKPIHRVWGSSGAVALPVLYIDWNTGAYY